MSSIQSISPATLGSPQVAVIPPVRASAPRLEAVTLPTDTLTIGGVNFDATTAYVQSAVKLAESTPQQLALLAAKGDDLAAQVLAERNAAQAEMVPAAVLPGSPA
jgi:hypothetical protein